MRIVLLVQGMAGYLDASFRGLHELGDELLVVYPASMGNTAFEDSGFCDYAQTIVWETPPAPAELVRQVSDFSPDAIVMGSWGRPAAYRAVMKAQPSSVLRILAMDNLWSAKPRQWLGRATHRLYLDPLYDCVMVASDRTEWFARRLGFAAENVIRGLYTADTRLFDRGPRSGAELAGRRTFLFAGRLVADKGVDILAVAYAKYRRATEHPWDLRVVGIGELRQVLDGTPGVTLSGFVQPEGLVELMSVASCFVLPSRFDHYGVVLHEAAAAGLPLLVSDVVGAAPGLLQDGYNGWVVSTGSSEHLSDAMLRVSRASPERLEAMSAVSRALSTRLSPAGWARNLHEEILRRTGGAQPVHEE